MFTDLHIDPNLDNRTIAARKWKEYFETYLLEMGDNPTRAQITLIRRLATLEISLEREESKLIEDPQYQSPDYTRNSAELSRTLSKLGLVPELETSPKHKDFKDRDVHGMSLEVKILRAAAVQRGNPEYSLAADKIDALMKDEDNFDQADREVWRPIRDQLYREEEQPTGRVRLIES